MSYRPWFLSETALRETPNTRRTTGYRVPSGVVRLIETQSKFEVGEFAVPSSEVQVELIACAGQELTQPGPLEQLDEESSVAVLFEQRGAGELPRYDVLAPLDHNVGAVLLTLSDGEVDQWSLFALIPESMRSSSALWAIDSDVYGAYQRLSASSNQNGRPMDFWVARSSEWKSGIGNLSHSSWDGLALSIAISGRDEVVDGRTRVWLGTDKSGDVQCVALDVAHAIKSVEVPTVDPWTIPVAGGLSEHADANFASLVNRARPFWVTPYFPGRSVRLGQSDEERYEDVDEDGTEIYYMPNVDVKLIGYVPLAGQIFVGDPSDAEVAGTSTGFVAQPGVYPVFLSVDAECGDTAVMIRFDSGTPARWSYAPGIVLEDRGWRGNGLGIWTDQTPAVVRSRPVSHHITRWNGDGSGLVSMQPNADGGGGVCEVYVAFDESDAPIAIVFDVFNMVTGDDTHVASPGE